MAATLSGSSANSILCLAVAVVFDTEVFFAEALVFFEALFFEVVIFVSCGLNERWLRIGYLTLVLVKTYI